MNRIFANDEHAEFTGQYRGIDVIATNQARVIVCMPGNLYYPVKSMQEAKLMIDNYIDIIKCN